MTDFEVSCYYKKDKKIIGAEVKVYNEDEDVIDRILITDAHGLEELESKLDNLDDTYVDKNELITALKDNVFGDDTIDVNAKTFDGHDSSYYALAEHNHNNQFAPNQHQSNISTTYGAGTGEQYGHVKVRDDLNARNLNISEALSSHQGYVINDRLTTVETTANNIAEAYYRNSMKIKIGRWSDNQGEDGTRIQVQQGSGNGIYAKLYCDKPGYDLNERDVVLVVNGIPYIRTTDNTGKTSKLTINLSKGRYLLTAFVRGMDGVYPATDIKIIEVL